MKKIIFLILFVFLSSQAIAQTGAIYSDAIDIDVDSTLFTNRLTSTDDNLQEVSDRLDDIIVVNANNCQGLTSGRSGDLCIQDDTGAIYRCDPSIGACDTSGEWKAINTAGNAATATALASDPADCSSGQAGTGINAFGVMQNCTSYQASDTDLDDLADGSLTGTKVGFADTDNNFSATNVQSAIEELDDVNGSGPNALDGKVDWSQLVNVPSGFADGDDATGSGGGGTCWELDINSDVQPVTGTCTDVAWEEDGNGDLQPQT